jgi:hypothetical protein
MHDIPFLQMASIDWYINGILASRPKWAIFNDLYFSLNNPLGSFI